MSGPEGSQIPAALVVGRIDHILDVLLEGGIFAHFHAKILYNVFFCNSTTCVWFVVGWWLQIGVVSISEALEFGGIQFHVVYMGPLV